jgi:transcriptional regulator with XRE-family HTH domain
MTSAAETDEVYCTPAEVGARVRWLRTEAGQTPEQVAAATGMLVDEITAIEAGTRITSGGDLLLLGDHFDVRASALTRRAEWQDALTERAAPEPFRAAMREFHRLIDHYFGLEAMVGR